MTLVIEVVHWQEIEGAYSFIYAMVQWMSSSSLVGSLNKEVLKI